MIAPLGSAVLGHRVPPVRHADKVSIRRHIFRVLASGPLLALPARMPSKAHEIVIALDEVPRIIDREYALKLPELAVLSAMAHSDLEVLGAAFLAIATLPEDVSRLYFDMIAARWPAAARRFLEAQMQGYPYQSEFARKYYGQGHQQGRKEGLQEGRQEGRQEGIEEGRTQGLREAVLALAGTCFEEVTAEDRAAIAALDDRQALTFLISALGQAQGSEEARGAFELVVGRR